jgi:ABC-2 type transport system ATP-binding protein
MPNADEPILRAESLTKDYGRFRALDSLNLSIPRGEIFGLLGPNGAGKSTAIRMVLGFMKPTAGKVTVAGLDCWRQGLEVRRQVSYLPGELRLYENMTGRQLVGFLGKLRGETPGTEMEALARRLDINIDKPLTQMSSGMKRKVALLTVLVPQTPLIILDEPTNTLDPTMRDELLDQLVQARKRGRTIVFSSHVLTEVEKICDRVGILRRGELVHLETMDELRREGRWVKARFQQVPTSGPRGEQIKVDASGVAEFQHGGPLPELLGWLAGQPVTELTIEPLSLAPIYHRYHGGYE